MNILCQCEKGCLACLTEEAQDVGLKIDWHIAQDFWFQFGNLFGGFCFVQRWGASYLIYNCDANCFYLFVERGFYKLFGRGG